MKHSHENCLARTSLSHKDSLVTIQLCPKTLPAHDKPGIAFPSQGSVWRRLTVAFYNRETRTLLRAIFSLIAKVP